MAAIARDIVAANATRIQEALGPLARRLLANRLDAEDAVQEVWVEFLTRPSASPRGGWLRLALLHAAWRIQRREHCRQERERLVARRDALPSVLLEIERSSLRSWLLGSLRRLGSPYAEVLRQRFIEERSIQEISAASGHSPATVQSQIQRGLAALRERLRLSGAGLQG